MKKLLAGILSVVMCAAMLTACSKENPDSTESAAASDVTTTLESVTETEITTAETTEAVTEAEIKNSYENIAEFVVSDPFKLETETVEGSLFSDYMEKNISDEGMYFDMETPDGKNKMLLAYKDGNMCVKVEGNGDNIYVYVLDGIMYILDSAEKAGFSMTMDQDTVESLKDEAMGGMDLDSAAAEVDKSQCVDVEIDGELYTFENLEEIGVLFHKNGDIYAVLNGGEDEALQILLVNEMSSNVPEGILELPKDYEIIDMEELFAGLEDYDTEDSGEAVKSDFATMDEFLKTDFTKLEGTEYNAADSLSAGVAKVFTSDVLYASCISDGEPMTVAYEDDKVMLEGDFGGTGELMKFIIKDNKFYAVVDSEKTVLVSSAEEIGTAEVLIEESKSIFADVSLSDKVPVKRAEVTIGGKKYFIESDIDDDSCFIFDENKELYALVDDGDYIMCNASNTIPAGTFDIPSDYEVVNLDEVE